MTVIFLRRLVTRAVPMRSDSPFQKLRRLSPSERRLLLAAGARVAWVRAALWVLPFRKLRRWAERSATRSHDARHTPERIAWAVTVVSRLVPRATCLTQALAAQSLLSQEGFPSTLHVGVARSEAGEFLAHAWVEYEERVLIGGSGQDRYAPIFAIQRRLG